MNATNQAIYARLANVIDKENPGMAGLLATIATQMAQAPQVASAMLSHLRDIYHDDANTTPVEACREMYRRTFFDPETAALYGTGHIPEQTQLLENFVHGLELDSMIDDPANDAGKVNILGR